MGSRVQCYTATAADILSRYRAPAIKLAVTVVVATIALVRWDVGAAFFLSLLVASVSGLVDRRLSVALGLLSLACCALLLAADYGAWLARSVFVNYYTASAGLYSPGAAVPRVTTWAYYFLCIGVVAQITRAVVSSIVRETAQ